MLDKLFQLSERGTTVKTEILAGITTFITMAYILFLAPNILSLAGMDKDAVLIATALGAGLVTISMGLFVNYPIALAPGVGLLAFYSFTVVLGMGVTWQTALGAVFISGLVFLVLTLTSIRQMIVEGIPASMKVAITVGIGLFIAIIGLKLSGLMAISISLSPNSLGQVVQTHGNLVPPASEALLTLGNLHSGETLLALFSLIFTALLMARKIQGSLLIGVAVTTLLSYVTGLSTMPENFTVLAVPDFSKAAFLQLDIPGGGRTGLTAVTTGVLFLICLFLAPIVSLVPNAATSPVLIIVGALMLGAIRNIDFDDWTEGFPAYLVIVLMPFTYSIANGISAGLVAYPLLKIISGRAKEVNWIMYVLAVLVIIRYVFF